MKYLIIPMLLGSMFFFASCNEETIISEESKSLTINLQMPDEQEDDAMTRVGLNPINNSKDLYATWNPDDKVQAILCKGNDMYDLGRVQVTNVSNDKRSATVIFDRRETPNVAPPYTIFLFTGNDYPASADMIGGGNWAAYCYCELQRAVGGYFHAPLYCRLEVKNDGNIPTAQFQHFGTYELLHVYNATNLPITFAHQGFETERPWYQASHTMWFYDGYDAAPNGEWDGDADSQTMTIMPGSENIVYSWYIPSGFPVNHARLVACVNGNYNTQSTNTFSSTIVPKRGHAYHMYATWDGKELKFKNGDEEQPATGTPEGLEAIDLGLPSGTLWANMNVGAESPEDYGGYYAWGETEAKETYNRSTYFDSDYNRYNLESGLRELLPEDDAATANWGSGWQMPSKEQLDELINSEYTTAEWTTQGGVNGRLITSKSNGNSIFLPAAGCRWDTSLGYAGSDGHYWSRSLYTRYSDGAYYLYFGSGGIVGNDNYRVDGQSVRPVRVQN